MTGTDELAILNDARAKLTNAGHETYLGRYLNAVAVDIEQHIRSDGYRQLPELPSEARKLAADLAFEAQSQAKEIISAARVSAAGIIEQARQEATAIRLVAVSDLNKAMKVLEGRL